MTGMTLPLSERATKVLAIAEINARAAGRRVVGTAEILEALMDEARSDPGGPVGLLLHAWRTQPRGVEP